MSKVHPGEVEEASAWASTSTMDCIGEEAVYTIWMKSLILGGKGCTVYDSKGRLVYRVDNYNSRFITELTLMDSRGKLLCTLSRKNFKLFGAWEGFRAGARSSTSCNSSGKLKHGAWFRVQKPAWKAFSNRCEVNIIMMDELAKEDENVPCRIRPATNVNSVHKKKKKSSRCSAAACTIVDSCGVALAEVKRKQSAEGVVLGEDVSTLKLLHPNLDPSLIISLLLAYALLFSHIMI